MYGQLSNRRSSDFAESLQQCCRRSGVLCSGGSPETARTGCLPFETISSACGNAPRGTALAAFLDSSVDSCARIVAVISFNSVEDIRGAIQGAQSHAASHDRLGRRVMKQRSRQTAGKQALILAAMVLLSVTTGCKRSDNGSTNMSTAASSALNSSGVMNGNAATGSTADTSSGAAAAATGAASTPRAAVAASGASQ